jgi:hypothetical protein
LNTDNRCHAKADAVQGEIEELVQVEQDAAALVEIQPVPDADIDRRDIFTTHLEEMQAQHAKILKNPLQLDNLRQHIV